ncbi:MAG: hypothetical protein ABI878_13145 [Acidobacteriota bacterium]
MGVMEQNATVMESVRSLLTGAIDYAGLFPPSQLSMSEAVVNYALNRSGQHNWMLGRFVLPVARLSEFLDIGSHYFAHAGQRGWHLSVLAGESVNETIRQVVNFNEQNAPNVVIDSLEVKANTVSKIENTVAILPPGLTTFFEIGIGENFLDLVSTLALRNQRAKIRTGGVVPEDFPKSSEVIKFVRACVAANVPFKATAGLHHPIRCFRPLTYSPTGPKGTMHGFLNLFLMTGFARKSYKKRRLEELMEDEFDEVFRFEEPRITWREDNVLDIFDIQQLRIAGITSFGSCSFDEPVADLQGLGIL